MTTLIENSNPENEKKEVRSLGEVIKEDYLTMDFSVISFKQKLFKIKSFK